MSDEKTPIVFSINQVVALNLYWARTIKEWTQARACQELAPYLGEQWSVATYSAAEKSRDRTDRVRQFNADDLVAFAAAFGLPVQFFFVPPTGGVGPEDPKVHLVAGDRRSSHAFDVGEYMRVAFGSPEGNALLHGFLGEAIERSQDQLEDAETQTVRDADGAFARARTKVEKDQLAQMRESLMGAVALLDDLIETGVERPSETPE